MRRVIRFLYAAGILGTLCVSGCSLPRIIILKDPLTAEEHNHLGTIYESQGKNEQALEQYRAALEKDPKSSESLRLAGDLAFRMKRYEEAESVYNKAIQIQPENGDLYNNLCWVYLEQGAHLEQAAGLITKALSLDPAHRAYYLDTQGVVRERSGRPAEAIASFREALSLLHDDERDARAEVLGHLADAYASSGDHELEDQARKEAESLRLKRAAIPGERTIDRDRGSSVLP